MAANFLACDFLKRWKNLVGRAKTSVTVFTPFFDQTLVKLVTSPPVVSKENITIVTEFSAETLLRLFNQLKAMKKLLDLGFAVLRCEGLHAKVLLIDDQFATVGSQNFTKRGRRNKETTYVSPESLAKSRFLRRLLEWKDQSTPIDPELVDELLKSLECLLGLAKQLNTGTTAALAAALEGFRVRQEDAKRREQEIRAEILRKQLQRRRQHFNRLRDASRVWLRRNREAWAEIKTIHSSSYYKSLKVDPGYDLTDWYETLADGSSRRFSLERCHMYPILMAGTNRMAFVRVTKRQITLRANKRAIRLSAAECRQFFM